MSLRDYAVIFTDGETDQFYYPIGNTRSVDVTHGCQVAEECDILLLGCGDIRHVLHTMHVLHQDGTTKTKNQTINFHVNDIEEGILARDLVLLFLARTINPTNTEELKTLWAVWYDVLLSSTHLQKLKEVMEELSGLKSGSNGIYFGNGKTELKIKQALRSWLGVKISARQTIDKRTDFLTKMNMNDFPERAVLRVSSRLVDQSKRLDLTQRLKDRYQQEVREYITSGVSRVNSSALTSQTILDRFHGNVTFFRPGRDNWRVEDNSCPFMCYDVELQLDRYNGGDVTMCSLFIELLRKWVKSYQAAIKTGCTTRIYLWLGDATEVCDTDLPDNLLFDFIDTSNIADRVGLIPLLVNCQQRLKQPNGVLRTETFHWNKGSCTTLESFLRLCLDVPQLMYPTLFGLHLAEELTLGHENILVDGSFVGVTKLALRWKASREQELLTLYADGGDALSKCLAQLKSRKEVLDVSDSRDYDTTTIDSKSKDRLMHRLTRITTGEATEDSNTSGNTFTVVEDIDHYKVTIKTDPEFLKDGIFTTDNERRDPYVVVLKNTRNGSTSFSKTLRFACGICINTSSIKLSRKRGTVEAHLVKDPGFTLGDRLLPWKKLDKDFIGNLPDLPRSDFGKEIIMCYVSCMHLKPLTDLETATSVQQLQSIVGYLMKTAPFSFGVPTDVAIRVPSKPDTLTRVKNRFCLEGLKIYENIPTMFLTFLDVDKLDQLFAQGKISREDILPFPSVTMGCMELDSQSAKYLAPGYSLLMQILELNSHRRAQDHCQDPDERWVMRTFLRARYPYMDFQTYNMSLSGISQEDFMRTFTEMANNVFGGNYASRNQGNPATPQAASPSTQSCDTCGRTSADCKKCTGCQLVSYCDRKCQRKAWPFHKLTCRRA
ncbi:uncharacterized protein LOC124143029 isoform X2 [Haliotis rufescens]|uniref:uncharacterized protein LOC124143029 isoform X2 n=1 Tax=Haliotis rufescens TaxID=6454 RepID=UPI00201F9037|nr:uncharacterized protein LOC124143029 isoform X2 [Haliotis rufescens]